MKARFVAAFRQIDWRLTRRSFLLLTLAAVIQAFNFRLFLAPSNIAPGGVSGLTLIIHHYTGWAEGRTILLLSLPLLLLGFLYLGRWRFLFSSFYVTFLYTMGVDFLAPWLAPGGITDERLLQAIFGGVVGGIAAGLALRGNGLFVGTTIISRVLQLRTGIPITQMFILIDGGIIFAMGLVFGWENALYSLVMLFIWGVATDYVLEGPSVVRTVVIVTNSPEVVAHAIFERLGVGVTSWPGQGMFTHERHTVMYCTINRPDVSRLRQAILEVDPHAFVVIGQGHQASGGVLRRGARVRTNGEGGAAG
ncbi:MAG: YitT family protein [Caldilineales bacterium]|nr:YitT family protein [Caldilineales bacterium]MCW5858546.1 YitT family protein [Caldilineales bacterium]